MIITRTCSDKDKQAMKKLWIELFQDSRNFTDWFFENRFLPEYCTCAYDDDILISCMQSIPMTLQIRDKLIPSVIISGVSTIKEYRKQGLMHKTFLHFMNKMYEKGIIATSLKAVSLPVYYTLNHYGCTESAYISSKKDDIYTLPSFLEEEIKGTYECKEIDVYKHIDDLCRCYSNFANNYSCIAIRNINSFKMKMDDYLSDDALAVAVFKQGRICAYCIFFEQESIKAEEFIADGSQSACMLYRALKERSKDLTVKVSSDTAEQITDKGVHIEEQNSMGIINICSLLRTVCNNKDYSVKVTDSFYNKNNGIYLFNGDNSNGKYHLEMTSGQLIRLITGHMSLDELVTSENAVIYDTIACREISNMLPKVKCFIVDEY